MLFNKKPGVLLFKKRRPGFVYLFQEGFVSKKKRKEERTGVVQPGEEPGVLLFKKEEQVFVSFNN